MDDREKLREIEADITGYKQLLKQTDYNALKYTEGCFTEEEYAPIKAKRQSFRDRINELEAEKESLSKEEK